MRYFIQHLIYLLGIYLVYRFSGKFGTKILDYIKEVLNQWPKLPKWLNWVFGVVLVVVSIILQDDLFFASLIGWLILSIILPLLFLLYLPNIKSLNLLSVTSFLVTTFFALILIFNSDHARDKICKTFMPEYKVSYTTEIVKARHIEDDDREIENAHIDTGNKSLDFFLESVFTGAFDILITILILVSWLLNISIRDKRRLRSSKLHNQLPPNASF